MTLEFILAPIAIFSVATVIFLLVRPLPRDRYSTFVAMAIGYAHAAHTGQVRKYTGVPYITHCIEVLTTLEEMGMSDEVLAAAVLHDTVEDTSTTLADIAAVFGAATAALVEQVTDVSRPEDGNRVVRKALDAAHLNNSSSDGASIKLADIISNTSSIVQHDPNFARVYIREKFALMPLLAHGNCVLFKRAMDVIVLARDTLEAIPAQQDFFKDSKPLTGRSSPHFNYPHPGDTI